MQPGQDREPPLRVEEEQLDRAVRAMVSGGLQLVGDANTRDVRRVNLHVQDL